MFKVLLANPDLEMRSRCYNVITQKGHQAVTLNVQEDLTARTRIEHPDLVLMDFSSSDKGMQGKIRNLRSAFPRMPIAVFLETISSETETAAYEAGANEVIDQNVDAKTLGEKIDRILNAKDRLFSESKDKGKILLVDDDDNVRRLLSEFFTRKGFETLQAANGEKALEMVRKERPTMILLDITMPGMDGILTLKKIREIDSHVGVVMATAIQDEAIAKQAMELGAYHYVLKPFDLKYLELVVLTRLVIAS